jgi:hypothetical protein
LDFARAVVQDHPDIGSIKYLDQRPLVSVKAATHYSNFDIKREFVTNWGTVTA